MTRATGAPIIRTRRWTRREYDRLIELGVLHEDEPIELLAGRLVVREPQRTPNATATQLAAEALRTAFGTGWSVRVQLPIALDDASEPEPDVAVVPGAPRDYLREHPSAPVLVVEVAHDSLHADRTLKARRRRAYADVRRLLPSESIAPLAAPSARVDVADLLP